jgi:phospholipid-transporting ATPase
MYYDDADGAPDWSFFNVFKVWILNAGTWMLLFTNMVPISLLVTLEIVKFFQARNICWDASIYKIEIDMPTKV